MTELLDLDDNCLEHVFNYCDVEAIVSISKVCKRFNAIATTIHFPKQTTLKYYGRSSVSEKEICEILRCIGKYLIELDISTAFDSVRFYQMIGRSVGERIRKLSISEPEMSDSNLRSIEPVLKYLEELKLCVVEDRYEAYDLRSKCPNLRRLHIQWNTSFTLNIGPWPRLEAFTLGDNEHISEEEFREFAQHNPQLRALKIGCFNCDVQLNDIAQYLNNLEQLVLFQNYSNLSPDSVLDLKRLNYLQRLILRNVEDECEQILNSATELNGLIELQIQARVDSSDDDYCELSDRCLANVALQMTQLQVFGIANAKFKSDSFLEFLRLADNLREIHVHDCDFTLTTEFVSEIKSARSMNRNQIGPLVLYINRADFSRISSNGDDLAKVRILILVNVFR